MAILDYNGPPIKTASYSLLAIAEVNSGTAQAVLFCFFEKMKYDGELVVA